MRLESDSVERLRQALQQASPQEILELAVTEFTPAIAISFSGAGSAVLIDMATRMGLPLRAFTLDTGRLHAESYRFLDEVRERYGIPMDVYFPQASAVEELVREKGLFSFYRDGHQECCAIRKVEPLKRALNSVNAWITGQRRDQSPGTRSALETVEVDKTFSRPGRTLVKFNPLAAWTSTQLWDYIRAYEVPFNALHERGYASIGCEPCTRPVLPGQHERECRWWWERENKKECGLHAANLQAAEEWASAAGTAR